jgi:hypothetical protein
VEQTQSNQEWHHIRWESPCGVNGQERASEVFESVPASIGKVHAVATKQQIAMLQMKEEEV